MAFCVSSAAHADGAAEEEAEEAFDEMSSGEAGGGVEMDGEEASEILGELLIPTMQTSGS